MRILLDTNVFLWFAMDDSRLTEASKKLFLDGNNKLFLSIASSWEIFIKLGMGKLIIASKDPAGFIKDQLTRNSIALLGITYEHTAGLLSLPPIHKDPFDRIIIAQALHDNLPVLSSDSVFVEYGVRNLF
jgi:PIN domain nuclease of toxin-antitoxin system